MTGQEDRRAALVERLAQVIDANAACPTCTCGGGCRAGTAEAVLRLLESGDAGVRVVAEGDLQETVGVVLAQLREARAELAEAEQERDDYGQSLMTAHIRLDAAHAEIDRLRREAGCS